LNPLVGLTLHYPAKAQKYSYIMSTKGKHVTWGGRFAEGPSDLMMRMGESVSFDARLAPYDLRGSAAHARMLAHVGIISQAEGDAIVAGLQAIGKAIEKGEFSWDISLEDVHMNIEQALTQQVPAAAKLHTARSRNDQVATDMRLWFKDHAAKLEAALRQVMRALVARARATATVYIPGYTHLQRAQPVPMAHHFLAYVEMFERDCLRLRDFLRRANVCPLGSGAIAGTTLPIDRAFVARELGFVDEQGQPCVTENSMDAVADRDLFIEFAQIGSLIGLHASRFAEDSILWSSAEFGFIRLPDRYTTGSSLMPQKKNPDAFELIRGKSGRLCGHVTALQMMVKGLPLTYNRDLQEDKPPVFDTYDQCELILAVLADCIPGMEPNLERCLEAVSDPLLLATDVVDYLVRRGLPFRDAHHVVGALVAEAEKSGCALSALPLDIVQAINPLFEADWIEVFDIKQALARRMGPGMPGPDQVEKRLNYWQTLLG
jgi:argininosuccinate lyase